MATHSRIGAPSGRPQSNEAGQYFFRYIDRVRRDDILAYLGEQLDAASTIFASISEEKSLHRYAPDKWSIRQLLNHVSDTERIFTFRALWFARRQEPALASFDENITAESAESDRISWSEHVEEFRRVRLSSISFFEHLPPDAWMRTGIANNNSFTVRGIAFILAGHVEHHLGILRERYVIG